MVVKSGYRSFIGDYVFANVQKNAREYTIRTGKQVVDLGVGDVKLPPPKCVLKQMQNAILSFGGKGFCGYPPDNGYPFLREAISDYYKRYGASVCQDEIFITEGAKNALGNLFEITNFKRAFIPLPTYPLYRELCLANGVRVKTKVATEKSVFLCQPPYGYKCDVIFLCSPSNPTGAVVDKGLLEKYLRYAKEVDALLVIDGAYADYYDYFAPFNLPFARERLIEIRSYSKSIGFTGVRCGYIVICKQNQLYEAYKRRESLRTNGVNYFAQRGAFASYTKECESAVNERIAYYFKNADILKQPFLQNKIKVFGGKTAPYILCKVRKDKSFCEGLLNEFGVVVTPGEAFGAKGYIRISCLVKREVAIEGAKLITKFLKDQKGRVLFDSAKN